MVAALCDWHPDYGRAVGEMARRMENREIMVVAGPALVEAYSVLTRYPPPHRLSPERALALLQQNFMVDDVETVALNAREYLGLLRNAPARNIAGGRVYDAIIIACALAAGVDTLLTFNERQFRALAPQGLTIVVPP